MNRLTVDEFFEKYSNSYQFEEGDSEHFVNNEDFKIAMVKFAKLHVEKALEAASQHVVGDGLNSVQSIIDDVLNAYPEKNIQ